MRRRLMTLALFVLALSLQACGGNYSRQSGSNVFIPQIQPAVTLPG